MRVCAVSFHINSSELGRCRPESSWVVPEQSDSEPDSSLMAGVELGTGLGQAQCKAPSPEQPPNPQGLEERPRECSEGHSAASTADKATRAPTAPVAGQVEYLRLKRPLLNLHGLLLVCRHHTEKTQILSPKK